jgi:hypothetical protein
VARKPTEKEMFDYLDEHLPYMLKMLRYTFGQIKKDQWYLDWNAYFESFAVNARNLVEFLTNGDKGNMKATYFILGGFHRAKNESNKNNITNLMKALDEQVFHLGSGRPREQSLKFGREAVGRVYPWIEKYMKEFVDALPKDGEGKNKFNAEKAEVGPEAPECSEGESSGLTQGPTQAASPVPITLEQRTETTSAPPVHIVEVFRTKV